MALTFDHDRQHARHPAPTARCEVVRPDNPFDVEDILADRATIIARGCAAS